MEELSDNVKVVKMFQEVMFLYKHSLDKVFEEVGITAPQGMVMGILRKEKKIKISDLSSKLSLSNSTVSGIIDRLENQGMVVRERSEEDKRVVYVTISTNFKEKHQCFHEKIELNIENLMKKANPEERNKVFEGLSILKKLLMEK